jgi:hypothetical protein
MAPLPAHTARRAALALLALTLALAVCGARGAAGATTKSSTCVTLAGAPGADGAGCTARAEVIAVLFDDDDTDTDDSLCVTVVQSAQNATRAVLVDDGGAELVVIAEAAAGLPLVNPETEQLALTAAQADAYAAGLYSVRLTDAAGATLLEGAIVPAASESATCARLQGLCDTCDTLDSTGDTRVAEGWRTWGLVAALLLSVFACTGVVAGAVLLYRRYLASEQTHSARRATPAAGNNTRYAHHRQGGGRR